MGGGGGGFLVWDSRKGLSGKFGPKFTVQPETCLCITVVSHILRMWRLIRVELCTMLVVASSMFFSLRCGTRTRSCPDIYRTLINFGNNSHFSLSIHSSVCWPWIDDDGYGYAGCENVYSTRIGAAAQVHIALLFYRYMSVIGTDWECRQLTRNVIWPLKLPYEIVFLPIFVVSSIRSRWNHKTNAVHWSTTQIVTQFWYTLKIITSIIKTI